MMDVSVIAERPVSLDPKEIIARRVALEIAPGMLVNLGIGLPSLVAGFVPVQSGVFFQAENGVIGLGARPPEVWKTPTSPMPAEDSSLRCREPPRSTAR